MNRSLPPGDRGLRDAAPCWPFRLRRALSGTRGLVRGDSSGRARIAINSVFNVNKHDGFARFWRETSCALTRAFELPGSSVCN
jgi:hypothetical protein